MKLALHFVATMLVLCFALPVSARGHGSYAHYSRSHHSRCCTSCLRDQHGRIKRSRTATLAFKKQQPCPSTGKSTGRCPGYVIDHVKMMATHWP